MLVSDLFRRLSYDQLQGLSWAGEGSGVIAEAQRPRLIQHANEGLLRLYSRFALKESELLIQQRGTISHYKLTPEFAASNPDRPVTTPGYILDTADDRFLGDVVRVFAVYGVGGFNYALNDDESPTSLFTPTPTILQVPAPREGALLSVLYHAKHPLLSHSVPTDLIELPDVLEPALLSYVAHKVFLSMNGPENSASAAQHLKAYEAICAEAVENDLIVTSITTSNTRFGRNGWR